ncbi:hypothetical protein Sste5346_002918 [Sporothrix stenoceras]|uniref:Amidase n=1 Tax=Sporothrix stenoceras TaxID=5173 RepID=A0ABR3ZH82_9PEZI
MPRNIRRKAAPAKSKRRRDSDTSSSLDLSSDGGYSALGEVSDSEDDDEEDVYAAEEKHIIQAATKSRHEPSPRPPVQNEEEDADEEEADGVGSDDDDDDDDDLEELDDADFTEFALEENANNGGGDDTLTGRAKFADDGASWNGISESDANQAGGAALPAKRQVRFAGVPDSDSDSSASEASIHDSQFFPDIFVEQGSLDPGFRREIENDSDSSVSSSFWDYSSGYGHDQEPLLTFSDADLLAAELPDPNADVFPQALADEDDKKGERDDEEDDDELDGYETDGDTTEDEEPQHIPLRRKLARRIELIDSDEEFSDSDSDAEVPVHRHGQPRARRFVLTPKRCKRPIAFIHPHTGKMVIYTPERPAQQHQPPLNIMSDPLFSLNFGLPPPDNDVTQSSPLMSNPSSLMMGAMISSNTFGDYMQTQQVGPIEAFFPSLGSDLLLDDSDFSGEYIDDDGESNLRIEDFIQFDRSSADGVEQPEAVDPADELFDLSVPAPMPSTDLFLDLDSGVPDEDDVLTPLATPMGPPASRRTSFAASSSIGADDELEDNNAGEEDDAMPSLLAHFDKNSNAVGAFRLNQINQQLIYSSKATADSLAFSNSYGMGPLRGIRTGSFEAVTTPITPPRRPKQRASMSGFGTDFNVQSSQESPAQKRKASSSLTNETTAAAHKRQRSINDIGDVFL